MGSGASSLTRLRKAVLIRAYNLRKTDETLDDQFRKYAFRSENQLRISIADIKRCLCMEPDEYLWIEDIFKDPTNLEVVTSISYNDFIRFLENGKMPSPSPGRPSANRIDSNNGTPRSKLSTQISTETVEPIRNRTDHSESKLPPFPPMRNDNSTRNEHISTHISIKPSANIDEAKSYEGDDEEVLHINLTGIAEGSVYAHRLPDTVKLHHSNNFTMKENNNNASDDIFQEETTIIIHPSHSRNSSGEVAEVKALWCKREVVRQERTVHYTTIDDEGALQELVEKETTQTEILHMECRETGEFAHRETTKYEQMETFNEDIVAAVEGQEEYVHLKSLEDEFHYVESTMPEGKGQANSQGGAGGEQKESEREKGDNDPRDIEGFEEGRETRPMTHEEEEEEQRQYAEYIARMKQKDAHNNEHDNDHQSVATAADGDPGEDAALEDYGFDIDQFAAHSNGVNSMNTTHGTPPPPSYITTTTSQQHTPQYYLDPEYCSPEEIRNSAAGVGTAAGGRNKNKGDGRVDRSQLFGERVELDENYGVQVENKNISLISDSKTSNNILKQHDDKMQSKYSDDGIDENNTVEQQESAESPLVRTCSYQSLHEID